MFYWAICLFLIDLLEFFIYSGCLSLIYDINCGYFLPRDSCSSLFMVSAAVLKFYILTEHIPQSLLLHCLRPVVLFSAVTLWVRVTAVRNISLGGTSGLGWSWPRVQLQPRGSEGGRKGGAKRGKEDISLPVGMWEL